MAIDGVKIIDSDLAHDVYGEFMDLYDADVEILEIKKKIESWRKEVLDEVEFEIFITAYGLALWEIGHLTKDMIEEIKTTINKGASVNMFRSESDEVIAVKRERVLKKFIEQIVNPKNNPRKRKKYKKITNFLLEIDSVLSFQMNDGTYRASILFNIDQYRGNCIYQTTPTAYSSSEKPTIDKILKDKVFIHKIGCGYDRETVKMMQPGIEKFWKTDKKFTMPFTIGLPIYGIDHKVLLNFVDRFELIGKIKIKDSFKKIGSIGYERNFEDYKSRFNDVINYNVNIFKYEMINLKEILD
jgi:hypothetical protein